MRLFDHLAARTAPDPVWIAGTQEISARDLRGRVAHARAALADAAGADVALACEHPRTLALLLVALDGYVSRLLLMPPMSSPDDSRRWLRDLGCAHFRIVTDSPGHGLPELVVPGWERLADAAPVHIPEPASARPTEWIIPTSGTSGVPKLVAHSLESLTRTTRHAPSGAGETLRWGLLYELHRFAGLQVLLQAWISRATLIIPESLRDLEQTICTLAATRCSALSATPSMWRKLLMSPAAARLPLRQITLGGEIADQPILSALATRHPQARLVHIYASTEAGVGFSVRDGRAGFPATYLDHPPAGIELQVRDDGILLVRPAECRQHYVGREEQVADASGWIDTGDMVERRGDRVHFLGRANGAINVGGRKVMPEEIETVILRVEGVALARVSGRRSSILGSLVEASVVPHPEYNPSDIRSRVQQACTESLEDYKRPAVLRVVPTLELSPAGKLTRW